jgi:glycosyltransferase involved in cell wall biosynthesis
MTIHQYPFRIAMATSSLGRGGAEKQFVYMARALHEAGVDLRVFYFGAGGFYEKTLRSIGVRVFDHSHQGKAIRILWSMIQAQRAFRPHIVMAGQFGDIIHAGIAGRVSGAITIAGVRNDGFWEFNEYRRRIWLMRRLPHALLANSHRAEQNLTTLGIDPQSVKVLTNVIDLQDFDHQSASPISLPFASDRIVVAAIGRLNRDKRFDRVLDVLALLRNSVPPMIGLIVGKDQGVKVALENRARTLGLLRDHLVFMGESDNVPALLKHCHILLQSSDYEGFPNTILEAMAARLPVVTTPAGDAPRVVENGLTGYVVDFENTKGMAERVLQLARSTELRRQLGEAGRQRVEEHHTFPRLSQRLFDIFRELAEQHRAKSVF